jgi:acyl-CoA synthetase (AMP-forming)/AMP-acid ligase II
VGKPTPGAVLKILDDHGRELAAGEVGEVVGRSTAMMSGYHARPDLTEEIVHRHDDGETYFRTGDLGRFDAEGFLYIVGRKKDVILSGGFNVYAVDLEDELLRHPDVAEAAVIGVPSVQWGETPVGVIVLRPGAVATAEEIRAFTNAKVGRNQRLSAVRVAAEIPRNAIGKPMKDVLRVRYATGS